MKKKSNGDWEHPLWRTWKNIKNKCYVEGGNYSYFGGRGIKMAPQWKDNFQQFLKDVGESPQKGLSLGRKDVNGDFSPENCSWMTRSDLQGNRRNAGKNNSTGYTYIAKKKNGKFKVILPLDLKEHDTLEEAIAVRDAKIAEIGGRPCIH
jgi:hypothetical protein